MHHNAPQQLHLYHPQLHLYHPQQQAAPAAAEAAAAEEAEAAAAEERQQQQRQHIRRQQETGSAWQVLHSEVFILSVPECTQLLLQAGVPGSSASEFDQ